jgi:carbon-monoxide dehydrogenase iron sulfur subunit
MKDVIIRPERCLGCRSCEIACAVSHSKSKNLFSALGEEPIPRKRVYVEYMPALGVSVPITCRHCEDAPCVSVCPTKALSKDMDTGAVNHNIEHCVDCWTCSTVCTRFSSLYQLILVSGCWTSSMAYNRGIINRRTDGENVIRCDLCEDRELPACVEACPTHALVFLEVKRHQVTDALNFP